jgi:hypothetical protein
MQFETFVLSLKADSDRRAYIARSFADIGLTGWRFVDAIPATAPEVRNAYASGGVAPFPPCFRCGRESCDCFNNMLIPAQVANVLSFRRLWQGISDRAGSPVLICEDDVIFRPGALAGLQDIADRIAGRDDPALVRLADSGRVLGEDPVEVPVALVSDDAQPPMTNPAHFMNGHMAALLAARDGPIDTTSDIWLNTQADDPAVHALTARPLLASELSHNPETARFASRIHPKGIDGEDRVRAARHVRRAETAAEYRGHAARWAGKPATKQWNYLASPAFQMRYVLAAGLLRHHRNILEIGSYKTPLSRFIDDERVTVRCLDPMVFERHDGRRTLNEVLDYRCLERAPFGGEPYALVILGLDLPQSNKLDHFLRDAEVAVIEFPEDHEWKRSRETFDALVERCGLHKLNSVGFDLTDNDFSAYGGPDEWPPRTRRFIHLVSHRHSSLDSLETRMPFVRPQAAIDTSDSALLNVDFAKSDILAEAAFDFSHGAFGPAGYLGGAMLYYTLPYMTRAQVSVCLGSGGALVPRLMRQAQRDIGLDTLGRTILVDGNRGDFGRPNWLEPDSAFRRRYPEIELMIEDTGAAAELLRAQGVVIDYLHIDADHSAEGSLRDFDAYRPLLRKGALVTFHDTRPDAHPNTTCWQTVETLRTRGFELLDMPDLASGVAIIRV